MNEHRGERTERVLNDLGTAARELGVARPTDETGDHSLGVWLCCGEPGKCSVESDPNCCWVFPHNREVWVDLGERYLRGHAK